MAVAKVLRITLADWQQRIGLAGQDIHVEGADQRQQAVAHRRLAADEQDIATGVRHDPSVIADIGLQHPGQVLGRGVAERDDGVAGQARPAGTAALAAADPTGTTR